MCNIVQAVYEESGDCIGEGGQKSSKSIALADPAWVEDGKSLPESERSQKQ